jgi:hypothetical protein
LTLPIPSKDDTQSLLETRQGSPFARIARGEPVTPRPRWSQCFRPRWPWRRRNGDEAGW